MRLPLLLLVGFLLVPGSSAPAADKDALSADARLDQPATLRSPMVTLRQAFSDLKDQTRVELTADEGLRGYTICVEAEKTPLRELMERVAEYSGYMWTRSGKEPDFQYRLTQDLKSRTEEERLRLEHLQKALGPANRFVELMSSFAAKFEKMDAKDVQSEVERLQTETESLPVSKERFAAEEQFFAASHAASPDEAALLHAYQALPIEAQRRLLKGERVLMGGAGIPGAVPMPEAVRVAIVKSRAVLGLMEVGNANAVDPNAAEVVQFRLKRLTQAGMPAIVACSPRYGVQTRAPSWGAPSLALTASRAEHADPPFRVTGTVRADNPADLQRPLRILWDRPHRSADEPATLCGGLTLPEIIWNVERADPTLHLLGDCPLVALARRETAARNESPRNALMALVQGPGFTLGQLCDEIAARMPMNVHVRKDGWVVLSSATPYDRPDTSIDPAWLKERFAPVLETSRLTPQAAGAAAIGLTRDQAHVLGELQLQFLADLMAPGELDRNHAFWKLFGSLKRDRQDDFLSGQPLRFGSLAPAEKHLTQEFLLELSADGFPYDLELSPDNWRSLEVALADTLPRNPDPIAANARGWGDFRNVEMRIARPLVSLDKRTVCAHWN